MLLVRNAPTSLLSSFNLDNLKEANGHFGGAFRRFGDFTIINGPHCMDATLWVSTTPDHQNGRHFAIRRRSLFVREHVCSSFFRQTRRKSRGGLWACAPPPHMCVTAGPNPKVFLACNGYRAFMPVKPLQRGRDQIRIVAPPSSLSGAIILPVTWLLREGGDRPLRRW